MQKTVTYKASGIVFGDYWGGGAGAYKSEHYHDDDLDQLQKEIMRDIESGAIDSGMGYEKVRGALMTIEIIETITIDGKEYTNTTHEDQFFGDLSDEECDFLSECSFN